MYWCTYIYNLRLFGQCSEEDDVREPQALSIIF